ncbi:MAG: cobalt ECF transporter T component CbiQ [Planctomycetota bacterium]|jgi:cobalt/nickel transport system permease protein|nr:cobalt ECF transporter T component CbiQ [Planctomycetota bacterium]
MIAECQGRKFSLFRTADPRTLLAAAAAASFCFSFVQSLGASASCLAFALILAAMGGISAPLLLKRLAAVNIFVLFIWLTIPFAMPGERIDVLGPLRWSADGIRLAMVTTIKCNAILLSFLALVSGIPLPLVGCALDRLRVPAKLVFLFLFTFRYVHVVGEEWQRLQTAAKLRGFVPSNSLHTYRTIGNMFGLTFVNAIDRSRRIYEAMLLRGFDGSFHTVTEVKSTPADKRFAPLFFAALVFLFLLDVYLR